LYQPVEASRGPRNGMKLHGARAMQTGLSRTDPISLAAHSG
jgi:hypothetical protein